MRRRPLSRTAVGRFPPLPPQRSRSAARWASPAPRNCGASPRRPPTAGATMSRRCCAFPSGAHRTVAATCLFTGGKDDCDARDPRACDEFRCCICGPQRAGFGVTPYPDATQGRGQPIAALREPWPANGAAARTASWRAARPRAGASAHGWSSCPCAVMGEGAAPAMQFSPDRPAPPAAARRRRSAAPDVQRPLPPPRPPPARAARAPGSCRARAPPPA